MALDSLVFAIWLGVLADFGPLIPVQPGSLVFDSVTITVRVEWLETATAGPAASALPQWQHSRVSNLAVAVPPHVSATVPAQAATLATGWGVGDFLGGEIGYLSVREFKVTRGWSVRTAMLRSLPTPREQELRWSLVRGVI